MAWKRKIWTSLVCLLTTIVGMNSPARAGIFHFSTVDEMYRALGMQYKSVTSGGFMCPLLLLSVCLGFTMQDDALRVDLKKIVSDELLTKEVLELGREYSYTQKYSQLAAKSRYSANKWRREHPYDKYVEWGFPLLALSRAKDRDFGLATGSKNVLRVGEIVDEERGVIYAYATFGERRLSCTVIGVDVKSVVEGDELKLNLPVIFLQNRWEDDYRGDYIIYAFRDEHLEYIQTLAKSKLKATQ